MTALSFGPFVLDLEVRELRRGHDNVPLSPKAFQLLEVLVANTPKALSKFALQEQLWPDTFVVEKNLVNLVAEIRQALGDDATHPRFVRTIHRFGYAFRDPSSEPKSSGGRIHRNDARFRLVWNGGRVGLADGEHVIGRDPDLQLFLDSPGVSRRHARLTIDGEAAAVEDLGSKNGTFVKGRKIEAAVPIADGDSIRVGSVELTLKTLRSRGSTQTEPRIER